MRNYNSETHEDLKLDEDNVINSSKTHVLPHCMRDHAVVNIFLSHAGSVMIESDYHPIRYGKHCGSRVILANHFGKIDYNPKFIWNGKEWLLDTYGTFVFGEIEINEMKAE